MIEGLKIGEVHPPEPRTSPIGYVECDECGKHHVVHQREAVGLNYCTCGGYFHWWEGEYPFKEEDNE